MINALDILFGVMMALSDCLFLLLGL